MGGFAQDHDGLAGEDGASGSRSEKSPSSGAIERRAMASVEPGDLRVRCGLGRRQRRRERQQQQAQEETAERERRHGADRSATAA